MAGLNTFKTVVEQDRMELLLRYPFYGRVICQCELVPVQSPNAPIASNDCRRIYLSETAYTTLPPDDRLLVLAHEVLHITLRHAFRKGNREEERFSFAADAEICPLLRDEFPQAPLKGYKKVWDGLTAEEIYARLPERLPETPPRHLFPGSNLLHGSSDDGSEKQAGKGEDEDQKNTGMHDEGVDGNGTDRTHRKGTESPKPEKGDRKRCPGEKKRNKVGCSNNAGSSAKESPTSAPVFDANTEMFCRQLAAEVQLELKNGKGRGDNPAKLLRLLEKINASSIDWRSLLRQFIQEVRGGSYRWLPPNRRFISRGLYLPGRRQKMFRGVVALDTSGSTVEDLPGFVGEVEHLMRSFGKFELTVIECDAAIGNITVVSSNTKPHDWRKHHFSGGGGTDFFPVFEYIKEKRLRPDVLVFFTDGDGFCFQKNPGYPVLWLLTENGEPPVSWGVRIKMKG